jgi:hypothetical protein
MTQTQLDTLAAAYRAYVGTFRGPGGTLAPMLQLKLEHTGRVVANARLIAAGEKWPAGLALPGEAAALLHDTGRYSQFARYRTFRDAASCDHAAESVRVITERRWLDPLPPADARDILAAVAAHNKKEVPPGLGPSAEALAHLVRDADKLDIFTVCLSAVADGSILTDPDITWGLSVHGRPSPEIIEAVLAGRPVPYGAIKSLSDFVLVEVGWLNGGLHYAAWGWLPPRDN